MGAYRPTSSGWGEVAVRAGLLALYRLAARLRRDLGERLVEQDAEVAVSDPAELELLAVGIRAQAAARALLGSRLPGYRATPAVVARSPGDSCESHRYRSAYGPGRPARSGPQERLSQYQLLGRLSQPSGLDVGQERRRHLRPLPTEQVSDCQQLHQRVGLLVERPGERPRVSSSLLHPPGWAFQRDQQPHLGTLGLHSAEQVAHHAGVEHLSALDADQRPADAATRIQRKPDDSIHASVANLTFVGRPIDQRHGPPLNVERGGGKQRPGAVLIGRDTVDVVGGFDDVAVGASKPVADQVDGEVGDVDPDPAATKTLCGCDGRATSAERVEHHIALVAARRDD